MRPCSLTAKGHGRKQSILQIARLIEVRDGIGTSLDFDLGVKWHAAESAVDEFNRGFSRILASAKDEPAFLSLIVGHMPSALITSVTLPGADFCSITMGPQATVGDGRTVPLVFFDCHAGYASRERALADYYPLVKLVTGATGLTPTPSKESLSGDVSTTFKGDGLIAGVSLSVSLGKNGIDVMYTSAGDAIKLQQ
jgi:hypothetical protein